jgi:structure-specific endonuclease subunit SLX1
MHMPICFGHIKIAKKSNGDAQTLVSQIKENCLICNKLIVNSKSERLTCIDPSCKLVCHIVCLSKLCLPKGHYIPIQSQCPICENIFMWGDLIRKKNGCCDLENDTNNTDLLEILELSNEEDSE